MQSAYKIIAAQILERNSGYSTYLEKRQIHIHMIFILAIKIFNSLFVEFD